MELILKAGTFFFKAFYAFFKCFPSKNKVVFISRQSNEISLDIELLASAIKEKHPDYKVVILCRKIEGNIINKIGYCFHMISQMYHLSTSKVAILDSYSILASVLNHKSSLLIIQMWHSVGTMKKFGYSILNKPEGSSSKIAHIMKMHHNYDFILCAGEGYRSHLAEGFGYPEESIEIFPLPRVAALKNHDFIETQRNNIFNTYPELKRKKNIIYAPTFRKNSHENQQFIEALSALKKAFTPYSDKYNLIIKTHPLSEVTPDYNEFTSFDMLSVADYLISDYSCIIYEGAILDIPLYFYTYDYDEYTKIRSIYMDYPNEIPNKMSSDPCEIFASIEADDYDFKKHKQFLRKYVNYEQENITESIVDFIWDNLK